MVKAFRAFEHMTPFPFEDVYLGLLAEYLRVVPIHDDRFVVMKKPNNTCLYRRMTFIYDVSPQEMLSLYHIIEITIPNIFSPPLPGLSEHSPYVMTTRIKRAPHLVYAWKSWAGASGHLASTASNCANSRAKIREVSGRMSPIQLMWPRVYGALKGQKSTGSGDQAGRGARCSKVH
ncbi:hypothetical protein Bbelb_215930 [Branchiostoma belcheri]|nr:hypothetical protein Bbelb_215930 [Branchiostoma belcheri]